MPQVIALVLNDGTQDVTFEPTGLSNGVASYIDMTLGVREIAPVVTLSGRQGAKAHTSKGKLTTPLVGTDDAGRSVKVEANLSEFTLRRADGSTDAEYAAHLAQFRDLVDDAVVTALTAGGSMY